jgi:hypothetical protein
VGVQESVGFGTVHWLDSRGNYNGTSPQDSRFVSLSVSRFCDPLLQVLVDFDSGKDISILDVFLGSVGNWQKKQEKNNVVFQRLTAI